MPYRDDIEALRARVASLEAEREDTLARLERARAALASVVADLAGLPPQAEIPWRSLHGGEPIWVLFVNGSDRKVELVWVSYDGRERPYATIVPGGKRRQHTYVAHLWRMVDPRNGQILVQRYVRQEPDARIVLA